MGLMASRKWEVKDRDPAVKMSDIRALMEELENLFLKGNILCLPPAETPSGAFAEPQSETPAASRVFGFCKTATQIVHEQLTEGFQIRYRDKLHVVHSGRSSVGHVLVHAMAEIRISAQATLGRLRVEFFHGNMRRALGAFDVSLYIYRILKLYF